MVIASFLLAFVLSATAAEPVRTAVLCGGPTFGRLCQLSGKTKPHVLVFNTAGKDDPQRIAYLVKGFTDVGAEAEGIKLWNVQIGDLWWSSETSRRRSKSAVVTVMSGISCARTASGRRSPFRMARRGEIRQ